MNALSHDRLVQLCENLKLTGVMQAYPPVVARASEDGASFTDFLESVLSAERDFRRARTALALVRMAGFPAVKTLDGYDFQFASDAPRQQSEQLAAMTFVARKEWDGRPPPLMSERPSTGGAGEQIAWVRDTK